MKGNKKSPQKMKEKKELLEGRNIGRKGEKRLDRRDTERGPVDLADRRTGQTDRRTGQTGTRTGQTGRRTGGPMVRGIEKLKDMDGQRYALGSVLTHQQTVRPTDCIQKHLRKQRGRRTKIMDNLTDGHIVVTGDRTNQWIDTTVKFRSSTLLTINNINLLFKICQVHTGTAITDRIYRVYFLELSFV
jgi:hypothetical protein